MKRKAIAIVCSMLFVTSLAIAPAAASHNDGDESFIDGLRDDEEDNWRAATGALISGYWDRGSYYLSVKSARGDGPPAANESAEEFQTYFNNHSQELVNYTNDRDVGSEDYEVFRIRFEQEGEQETVYLVANYNTTAEAYDNASVVDDTDREVDERITLEDYAAANAAEELGYFYENYVAENETAGTAYEKRLAGRYNGDVDQAIIEV